jgi:hypothetical protein
VTPENEGISGDEVDARISPLRPRHPRRSRDIPWGAHARAELASIVDVADIA